jgi:hypothetical protein
MVTALLLSGKGIDNADAVQFLVFTTIEEFNDFKAKRQNLNTKYWTAVVQVLPGDEVETYKECLKEE